MWNSCRLLLAAMGFLGFLNVYAMRVNLSVAMVCMVNQTAIRAAPTTSTTTNTTSTTNTNTTTGLSSNNTVSGDAGDLDTVATRCGGLTGNESLSDSEVRVSGS